MSGDDQELNTKHSGSKIVYQTKRGSIKQYSRNEDEKIGVGKSGKSGKTDYDGTQNNHSLAYGLDALGKCSTHRIMQGENSSNVKKIASEKPEHNDQMAMVRSISFRQVNMSSQ